MDAEPKATGNPLNNSLEPENYSPLGEMKTISSIFKRDSENRQQCRGAST